MADREKILRYFKAGGDEQLAAKLLDLAEGANKSRGNYCGELRKCASGKRRRLQ